MQEDDYFRQLAQRTRARDLTLELNLLDRAGADDWTARLRGHPIVDRLDGLVLDDPETSDHHVLLRRAPFNGCVLHLAHDDDSRVVFASLADWWRAVHEAGRQQVPLPELHPRLSPLPTDQAALSRLIAGLVEADEIDVALALIPSMDLGDTALLEALAVHEDFFLGETVAEEIAKRPSAALRDIARLCSQHPHVQARKAGARALHAIDPG